MVAEALASGRCVSAEKTQRWSGALARLACCIGVGQFVSFGFSGHQWYALVNLLGQAVCAIRPGFEP